MPHNELYPDPLFVEPFVDIDEWRDVPVRHRYVHGGFTGTDLRFSMYFPPAERYDGRFMQPLMHIAGNENVAVHRRAGRARQPRHPVRVRLRRLPRRVEPWVHPS